MDPLMPIRWLAGQFPSAAGRHARSARALLLAREARIRELEARIEAMDHETGALIKDRERTIRALELRMAEVESERDDIIKAREERIVQLEQELRDRADPPPPGSGEPDHAARAFASWQAADGWCSEQKALWLSSLAAERGVSKAVEIGVFGGKSLLPLAATISAWNGVVYGVESWSPDIAVSEPTDDENDAWWRNVDFEKVREKFFRVVSSLGLEANVRIIEASSDAACEALREERFDLIHIDGSHAPDQAMRDVRNWSRLLAPGGALVVDDIDWPSLSKVRTFILENFDVLDERREGGGVSYGAYTPAA